MNTKTKRMLDACTQRIEDLDDAQSKLIVESRFYRSQNLPWAEETEQHLASVSNELKAEYIRYSQLSKRCYCR